MTIAGRNGPEYVCESLHCNGLTLPLTTMGLEPLGKMPIESIFTPMSLPSEAAFLPGEFAARAKSAICVGYSDIRDGVSLLDYLVSFSLLFLLLLIAATAVDGALARYTPQYPVEQSGPS